MFIKLKHHKSNTDNWYNYDGHAANFGDTITMESDTNKTIIKFYDNEEDQGIAYEDIDFSENRKYQLAVFLNDRYICVQLIDFRQTLKF